MISVVVPVFNEEVLISRFHEAVANALKDIGDDWEVVYVNDGSQDASLEILRSLQHDDPHVVVVELSRNWGQVGALSAGLLTSRGDATILMDADFQDPPEVLPELIEAWRDGADVVVGVRRSRQESRKYLALLFPLFYRLFGALSDFPIPLNAGLFSLLSRPALDSINAMRERNRYLPGLRSWVGYNTAMVYYDRQDRLAGDGKLSFLSRIKYAMDAVCSFSYKPLRLCFAMAAASAFMTALLAVMAVFSGNPLHSVGFGVASSIFLVGTMLLLSVGVLGEYLGRVYDEVRGRPLSIINRVHYADELAPAQTGTRYEQLEPAQKAYRAQVA
jgi:polyisoprenyl-phosphate glycosyltransferase